MIKRANAAVSWSCDILGMVTYCPHYPICVTIHVSAIEDGVKTISFVHRCVHATKARHCSMAHVRV